MHSLIITIILTQNIAIKQLNMMLLQSEVSSYWCSVIFLLIKIQNVCYQPKNFISILSWQLGLS